jgi:hypothetical protein
MKISSFLAVSALVFGSFSVVSVGSSVAWAHDGHKCCHGKKCAYKDGKCDSGDCKSGKCKKSCCHHSPNSKDAKVKA